jgi:hypothetical protein
MDIQTGEQKGMRKERWMNIGICRQTDGQTDEHTNKWRDGWMDMWTGEQTDR